MCLFKLLFLTSPLSRNFVSARASNVRLLDFDNNILCSHRAGGYKEFLGLISVSMPCPWIRTDRRVVIDCVLPPTK